MKNPSIKPIHLILIGAALLLAFLVVTALQRNNRKGNAHRSGRFEQVYTSAIDSLHERTKAVRKKLSANMPGDLEILPEQTHGPLFEYLFVLWSGQNSWLCPF